MADGGSWADRGGARRGGQAPATRPGYNTASGENRWRGRRRGRLLRRHGARVSGSRLVRWARSAHRDTRRLDANATFWRGGVPMSISPKDALKSVVTRTMDSFCKFSEHLVKTRERKALTARRKQRDASIMREAGRESPLACLVVAGSLRASIHEPTRRRMDEDQQFDLSLCLSDL